MRIIEVTATLLLAASGSGCTQQSQMQKLQDFNVQLQEQIKKPAEGEDPNLIKKPEVILNPMGLIIEEESSPDAQKEVYAVVDGSTIQVQAARMKYPYIDGATPECELLTEDQMQYKREHPEETLTCDSL